MAEQTVKGRFVWHDLITPDQQAAAAFYSDALGWQSAAWDQEPSYLLFQGANGPLGGALEQPQATPHWLPFIGTDDLDAIVAETERLGGEVRTPPTELPNGGRYAVLADPQGAAFGVHWAADPQAAAQAPGLEDFSWHELATTDDRAALEFYQALFGWEKVREHDMGAEGAYVIFGRDGEEFGGIYDKGEAGAPGAYWLAYARVADLEGAVERATAARGSILVPPMDVPGGGRIAQLMDPHGAFFAVHSQAADVKRTEKPAPEQPESEDAAAAPPAKRPAKKAAAKKAAAKKSAKKAASSKKAASKKKAGKKKAAGKKATKKAKTKQTAKRSAKKAGKKAGKKTAKKAAKKAAKKSASRTKKKAVRKAAGKKAAKRAAKKTGKKTSKKTAKRAGKKTAKKAAKKSAARAGARSKAATKKRAKAKRPAKKARR